METQAMCESNQETSSSTPYAVTLRYDDGWGFTRTTIIALGSSPDVVRNRAENKADVETVNNVREADVLPHPDPDTEPTVFAADITYRDEMGHTRTTITVLDTDADSVRERVDDKTDVLIVHDVHEANTLADWP